MICGVEVELIPSLSDCGSELLDIKSHSKYPYNPGQLLRLID
jgi:hypothetical protein